MEKWPRMRDWKALQNEIEACDRCPRLRKHCLHIAKIKKREFREFEYWGKPVAGFGDTKARLWILGLAPAAHGANRTGRMFTGDSSGKWVYRALHKVGLANQPESIHRKDGLTLKDVFISAAARCAPPENKPTPKEISNCAPYLHREFALLKNKKLFLALGKIGFDTILRLLESEGVVIPQPRPEFKHGASYKIGPYIILVSYHPSRQNTQTRKLTEEMWDTIFETAKALLK